MLIVSLDISIMISYESEVDSKDNLNVQACA